MEQQPRSQLAAALMIVSVVGLLILGLAEISDHRALGWAMLAVAVVIATCGTLLWRQGAFRQP